MESYRGPNPLMRLARYVIRRCDTRIAYKILVEESENETAIAIISIEII
jgi:hypothetical protein